MLNRCTPTLFALALGLSPLAAADAPTDAERDEHAKAVRALIDMGARLSAKRQIDAFAATGYKDAGLRDALQYAFKVRFEDAAEQPAPGGSPAIVKLIWEGPTGLDAILKAVNDSRRILLDPEGPKPKIKPSTERVAALQRAVSRLVDMFPKEFAEKLEAVKKNQQAEDDVWNLKDERKVAELNQKAVLLRLDALRPFYFAHMVLREVVTRGADFGLDPKPVIDALAAFCKEHREMIAEWEFQYGEMHPQMQLYCAVFLGEAARQGRLAQGDKPAGPKKDSKGRTIVRAADVSNLGVTPADAESSMMRVCDLDLEGFPQNIRGDVRTLQLKAWSSLLRWQLEMADASFLERGSNLFADFRKRAAEAKAEYALTHAEGDRAGAVASVYLMAGRLMQARGDSAGAQSLWAEVRAARTNPLSTVAQRWLADDRPSTGNAWGKDPLAQDPTIQLGVGRALIAEADTAGPRESRQYYLSAAVALRDAILGLNARGFADQFLQNGPAVYRYYSHALNKLGMPYHAVAAAHEGLRLAAAEIQRRKGASPWKTKDGQYTTDGRQLEALANNGLTWASQLSTRVRTSATKRAFDDLIETVKVIDAEMVGEGLEWRLIMGQIEAGEYQKAVDDLRAFAKKYEKYKLKAYIQTIRARQLWLEKLEQDGSAGAKAKADEVNKALIELVDGLQKYLDGNPVATDARMKADLRALWVQVASARASAKLRDGKFVEVFTQDLGPAFWKKPPADPEVGVAMLRYLSQAVQEYHLALSGVVDQKKDRPKPVEAAKLAEAWKLYAPALADFSRMFKHYGEDGEAKLAVSSRRLAQVAQFVMVQADANLRQQADAEAMGEILEQAKRAYADFIYPFIDEQTKPPLILSVAAPLWDLGEHKRAVRLYELYQQSLAQDEMVLAYHADPKGTVEQFATALAARQEFRGTWNEVVDLLTDPEGFIQDLQKAGSSDALRSRGQKRDFAAAVVKIDELKKTITGAGYLDAETKKIALENCDRLRGLAANLALGISIEEKLAQYYTESGDAARAVKLYERLYKEYDPFNPRFAMGYVEGVLQALKAGQQVAKDSISSARGVAGENLAKVENQPLMRDIYWRSWLQVLELTKYMSAEEQKAIRQQLSFTIRNKTSPRDDLRKALVKGDDPRLVRALDEAAVDIANRYLALFAGTDLPVPFRIDTVEVDGRAHVLFVESGAPAMEGVVEEIDGADVLVFKPVAGAPAAEAPAAANPEAAAPAPESK